MKTKILMAMALFSGLYLVRNLYVILLQLPDEAAQGAIYRIMYFHVPGWITSFSAYFLAAVASIYYLVKRDSRADEFAVALTEVGTIFTMLGLGTGMVWARIIWGVWWVWDPRLTWAFICFLIYAGYLLLRKTIDEPGQRARIAAVVSLFAFVSVVITYKSIDWWRTQHPGAVLSFRTGGEQRMDPAMEHMLFQNWFALTAFAGVIMMLRLGQERMQRELDALRRYTHNL
ncbi:MAG: cytochrome c biogenesis protein CcsA [Bryobacterales bacterium]|nr:cytochrome c biogenesis protein CcsA [Bryobacterales bacterium]